MELTDDDVLEILKLFEQSKFDFLQLEQGERKITISKDGYAPTGIGAAPTPAVTRPAIAPGTSSSASASSTSSASSNSPSPSSAAKAAVHAAATQAAEGLVPVTAPMVGKFYSAPSPSDPPYVEVGTRVTAGATVGLIEVMKVFASIKTEASGVIERILASNGEFVESGQTLFLLRPDGPPQS